eukprot:TRINITY_DN9568_c0_g1_i4.p1 TRINITY_DN9568_c0_g1~~TRINITY_DN9568_c0_g1_i4.p1  ORF type:complete len:174 (+),score=32.93 TRINITY_DN9568_c0_g1_i4:627-1148(+)
MLKTNQALKLLHMGSQKFVGKSLAMLTQGIAQNSNLVTAFLQRCKLKDEHSDEIVRERNTNLLSFWVYQNSFSDKSAKRFEEAMAHNRGLIRSINVNFDCPTSFSLPSVLRNQHEFLEHVKFGLGYWLIDYSQRRHLTDLVDLKGLFSLLYRFYELPINTDWKSAYSGLYRAP